MEKHQKHAAITRPAYGHFARQEWAFIGAPCGVIKKLAFALIDRLKADYQLGYVDADHAGADAEVETGRDAQSAMAHGAQHFRTNIMQRINRLNREIAAFYTRAVAHIAHIEIFAAVGGQLFRIE